MALIITPSSTEDITLLKPRVEEQAIIDVMGIEHFYNLLQIGHSFSMWEDGKLIGLMGIYRLWPNVYETWILPSQYITQYSMKYLRTVKLYMKAILSSYPIYRLQTTAINNTLHNRWMTFLGFKKEGILKGYGPDGTDYAMWSYLNVKPTKGIN